MKKIQGRIASGLLMAGILSSALLPAMAKTTATKMSGSKMSGTKMSSSKMSPSKMSSKGMMTQMTGTVTSMTAHSLTVKPAMKSNGMSKTVMIPASAKIMMGAVPTKLLYLKAGEKVTITMNKGMVTGVRVVAANKTTKGTMMKSNTKMSGTKMSTKKR